MVRKTKKAVLAPPPAEPAMSGTVGSGPNGRGGPSPPAPPRRPRSRTGVARVAGEARRTRGARCLTPLGARGEKKSCVAPTAPAVGSETGGGGPARVPPVDDAARVDAAGACPTGGSAAGAAGVSNTANGVTSVPGEAGAEGDAVAGCASSE